MLINMDYDRDQMRFDWPLWLYRAILAGLFGLLFYKVLIRGELVWALWLFIGIMSFEWVATHLLNYGLRRQTEQDVWDGRYESSLDVRDNFNRQATIWWMLGRRSYALELIERADWAWVDAQLTLSDEDNPCNQPYVSKTQREWAEGL